MPTPTVPTLTVLRPRCVSRRSAAWVLLVALVALVFGCGGQEEPSVRGPAGQSERARARQSNALLESIKTRLARLPEETSLELRPPSVVLDARSTTDGEEAQALLVRRPDAPAAPANLLAVPAGNTRFRQDVKPGDIVKYYAELDDQSAERLRVTGEVDIATFRARDFVVAQVLRDDALLIEGGIGAEITVPVRMEVWRISDERMDAIQREWTAYVKRRDPPLAWQPTPDEALIAQLTERLNQWLRQTRSAETAAAADDAAEWIAKLPESLRDAPELAGYLGSENRSQGYFREYETRQVQGAIWRRDIARWARGDADDPVNEATALFDWVVRNVQLVGPNETPPQWPWEAMVFGQADAAGRAWVFAGLCEQRNLPAAIVTVETDRSGPWWLVGVATDAGLALFDPQLGLPLLGDGESVLTLNEARENDGLLRRNDLPDEPYPVTADALSGAEVALAATPWSLSDRAARLQRALTGDDAVTLAADLSARSSRVTEAAEIESVTLWAEPFRTLKDKLNAKPSERRLAVKRLLPLAWRPALWKGRTLQFRGRIEKETDPRDPLAEPIDDHLEARRLYTDRRVRPTTKQLGAVTGEKRAIYQAARDLATLWLGTVLSDSDPRLARNWLEQLGDAPTAESYRPLAEHHRALLDEQGGDPQEAASRWEQIEGPQSFGSRLRAARLRESLDGKADVIAQGDNDNEPSAAAP